MTTTTQPPYDSNAAYRAALAEHASGGRCTPDRGAYLPSPAEIAARIAMLRELRGYGFNDQFISSIMAHDTPRLEVVRGMVRRHGPTETWRRCKYFLADTEYG